MTDPMPGPDPDRGAPDRGVPDRGVPDRGAPDSDPADRELPDPGARVAARVADILAGLEDLDSLGVDEHHDRLAAAHEQVHGLLDEQRGQ